MNQEEAIQLLEDVLASQNEKPLSPLDRIILDGSWRNLEYKDIAEPTSYDFDSVRTAGSQLYRRLSLALGFKVKKHNLKLALEQWMTRRPVAATPATEIKGDALPNASTLYGRETELSDLQALVLQKRCVVLTGTIGIGKTALALHLAKSTLADPAPFSQILWLTLGDFRSVNELVDHLIACIQPEISQSQQNPNFTLIQLFQSQRCLVILEGAESGLDDLEYESLFLQVIKAKHESCVLLVSDDPPSVTIERWQADGLSLQIFKLNGLSKEDARQLLQSYDLLDESEWDTLIETYRGNPLYLSQVARDIRDQFGSSVASANIVSMMITGGAIAAALTRQTRRLSPVERKVLVALTRSDLATFAEIYQRTPSLSSSELFGGLDNLVRKGLVEAGDVVRGKSRTYWLPRLIHKHVLQTYASV